jgi:hypothetical protein
MGLLDKLFGKAAQGSSGLFNQANEQWQLLKQAMLNDDQGKAQAGLVEVIRLCQEAIAADPQKEGNSYVMLTNALLRADRAFPSADKELLLKYAAACIHIWNLLPHKSWPVTSKSNHELGIRWLGEIQQNLRTSGSTNPEATMAEYASLYGQLITSPKSFDAVRNALTPEGTKPSNNDADILSKTVKEAVMALYLAASPTEFGDRAMNVHKLAEIQSDALIEAINTLPADSPLIPPSTAALAELVGAMSFAEARFKSDPFAFIGAAASVQASWIKFEIAVVHDEANALARASEMFKRIHGLGQ